MRQKFFNPKTGGEISEPMGQERGMRGFPDKKPVAKKPVMKPGSRPLAHHPHDIVGARKKPHMPQKGKGEQPRGIGPNYDGRPLGQDQNPSGKTYIPPAAASAQKPGKLPKYDGELANRTPTMLPSQPAGPSILPTEAPNQVGPPTMGGAAPRPPKSKPGAGATPMPAPGGRGSAGPSPIGMPPLPMPTMPGPGPAGPRPVGRAPSAPPARGGVMRRK